METWTIIIIILAVINVIAFGTAIWVSYDKWKQGEREWVIPLMGLFFIPVCVFLVLAWPYMVYKENRAKLLEEQEREEAKKRRERSKKYHFKRFGFRLKALPFKPTSQELIYVENDFDERINKQLFHAGCSSPFYFWQLINFSFTRRSVMPLHSVP